MIRMDKQTIPQKTGDCLSRVFNGRGYNGNNQDFRERT